MNGWEVLRLVNALRGAGLLVSSQDLAEAFLCLSRYPEIPSEILLRSLLIHRPQDIAMFHFVWAALKYDAQSQAQRTKDIFSERAQSPYGSGGQHSGQGSGSLSKAPSVQGLASFKYAPSDRGSGEEVLEFEQNVKRALGHLDYYVWINSVDLAFQRGEISETEHFSLHDQGLELQNAVRRYLLAQQVETANSWQPLKHQYWRHKPLQALSSEEKNMVQAALRQLGRKLSVRPGLRRRQSRGGSLDFAQTVKRSCRHDGYIFHLFHHRPLPRLPELVLLCDVSNSVAPYSEFLLYLVGRLHTRFHRVRLFFFIDSIWDVSTQIWDEDMDELKEEIESWGRYATSGFSDYGQVFKDFAGDVLSEISSQATVLILGDGKNNFRLPQEEYLAQIGEHVRHIFWLNPLHEKEWTERDNALTAYRSFCTRVYRCRTLNDLQEIARILI
ncbi:VWA domain-containing protein [Paradesulfitobacterium ferrireducens]|uniref:VWA domain-containing protein n=1 Tax=Paradesulfitobacterium ferrireducens TaxID=2816476 RepID=UPI001A8CB5DA|nr:VWA domain-containing protein [Paradesulfitobacterium ferrireducens]